MVRKEPKLNSNSLFISGKIVVNPTNVAKINENDEMNNFLYNVKISSYFLGRSIGSFFTFLNFVFMLFNSEMNKIKETNKKILVI